MVVFGYLEREPYLSIMNDTFDDETMLTNLRLLTADDDPSLEPTQNAGHQIYSKTKILGEQIANEFIKKTTKSIVIMRLGWVNIYNNPGASWLRTVWLSYRDLCSFVDKVLESPLNISGTYFLTSNNHRKWMDIDKAKRDLNYIPIDGANKLN